MWHQQRADNELVSPYQPDQDEGAWRQWRRHNFSNVSVNVQLSKSAIPFLATTTKSIAGSSCWRCRKLSRVRRLIRLRSCARLTCFLATVRPIRGCSSLFRRPRIVICGVPTRSGCWKTKVKRLGVSKRNSLGKAILTTQRVNFYYLETVRRVRPFARRRART